MKAATELNLKKDELIAKTFLDELDNCPDFVKPITDFLKNNQGTYLFLCVHLKLFAFFWVFKI